MSDTCRTAERGFTLLEIVVVLAILGLVTAMVVPSVVRGIDSWRRQAVIDELTDQLRGLPAQARRHGRAIQVSDASLASPAPPLRIEAGWVLAVPKPWQVNANGACAPGQLEVGSAEGRTVLVEVRAPFCEPVVLVAGEAPS